MSQQTIDGRRHVLDHPAMPPGALVGDSATRVLLALVARPRATAARLAHRLNGEDWSDRLWTAERVEAQLKVLRRVGLAAKADG